MASNQKDPQFEDILASVNSNLVEVEESAINGFSKPQNPILFVIGAQRSGTTVLTQALASLYKISYPSNLIARFFRVPYIGAMLSNSLKVNEENMQFDSEFGATTGANGPHEFSYFWRHWFPGSAQNALPYNQTETEKKLFKKHLAAWQSISNEPLLFKNLLEVIPNIENLSKTLPTAVFINIERQDEFVIQSTHECRKKYNGNYNDWFGVKPTNYKNIQETKDSLLQVTEQVFHTKEEIKNSLKKLSSDKHITIQYENFITKPEEVLSQIENQFGIKKWKRNNRNIESLNLKSGNKLRLDEASTSAIQNHLNHLRKNK